MMDLWNVDDVTLMMHVILMLDEKAGWFSDKGSEKVRLYTETADLLRTVAANELLEQRVRTEGW